MFSRWVNCLQDFIAECLDRFYRAAKLVNGRSVALICPLSNYYEPSPQDLLCWVELCSGMRALTFSRAICVI